MKKFILVLVIMSAFTACQEDLEKSPLDEFDNATFWNKESNAMLALTAVYRGDLDMGAGGQNPSSWWSYQGLVFLETASDNAYHGQGDTRPWNRLTDGTLTANIGILRNFWTLSYKNIARANDFLANIGRVPMDEVEKKRMIAEARFIRACQYFYLSQHFGSAPLVKKVLSPEQANTVSKASYQELADFVITEFSEAAADLPTFGEIPAKEMGRASKQAALAFLGRIQLAEGLFTEAAATYKTIIDFGDNQIDPDYGSIFLEANENSAENIFSVQYVPDILGNAIMSNSSPRTLGGFALINPLGDLMEAYEFTDGTPFSYTDPKYDYTDLSKNRDPRLKYTIYYNNAPFRDRGIYTHPDSLNSVDRLGYLNSRTGYELKKYMDENFVGNLGSGYGGNMPVIRYAEVLLSYLEAKLEAGDPIDQALLDATINQVRGRASVNMPPITITDPALLRPVLRNERRVELAMEGIRLWDLLRWGIAAQKLNGDFYGHPFPETTKPLRKKKGAAADPYFRPYVTTRNFREGIDERWPVPQSEVNINPALE